MNADSRIRADSSMLPGLPKPSRLTLRACPIGVYLRGYLVLNFTPDFMALAMLRKQATYSRG